MKLFRLFSILTVTAMLMTPAYAAEQMAQNSSMSVPAQMQNADQTVHAIVTSDGRLVLKPVKIFTTGDHTAMELPYLISQPQPVKYPRWALQQGWEGEMVIAVEVLLNGKVGRYKVMQSTGYKTLDETAVEAIKGWKFHPAVENGKEVVTCMQVAVRFQIQ